MESIHRITLQWITDGPGFKRLKSLDEANLICNNDHKEAAERFWHKSAGKGMAKENTKKLSTNSSRIDNRTFSPSTPIRSTSQPVLMSEGQSKNLQLEIGKTNARFQLDESRRLHKLQQSLLKVSSTVREKIPIPATLRKNSTAEGGFEKKDKANAESGKELHEESNDKTSGALNKFRNQARITDMRSKFGPCSRKKKTESQNLLMFEEVNS